MTSRIADQTQMTAEQCQYLFYGIAAEVALICRTIFETKPRAEYEEAIQTLRTQTGIADAEVQLTELEAVEPELDSSSPNPENPMDHESSNPAFEYKPLNEPKEIRVLILHPGTPSQRLRATIRHDPISRASYEAISYTWGDSSKPCSIFLDGSKMQITMSLFNALTSLRYRHKDRVLWADGICIHQADNKEKSVQVALMPEIYTQAKKVLVYLGVEADGSELVPELLQNLGKAQLDQYRHINVPPDVFSSADLPPQGDKGWEPLLKFLFRPWFVRVWVVQEIILARQVQFICGNWVFGWQTLFDTADQFQKVSLKRTLPEAPYHELERAQQAIDGLGLMLSQRLSRSPVSTMLEEIRSDIKRTGNETPKKRKRNGSASKYAAQQQKIVETCRLLPELYPLLEYTVVGLPDKINPPSMPIVMLLELFASSEATRAQDRIFALIGLAADINFIEFPPDYDERVAETNIRFGKKLVEKGQGLDLLFHVSKSSKDLENKDLPSWAPEWTKWRKFRKGPLNLGWAYQGGFDNRVISTSHVSLVDGESNVLKVSGFRLDSCQKLVKFPSGLDPYQMPQHLGNFFEETDPILSGDPYFTGESWEEVGCRTLIAYHLPKNVAIAEVMEQYRYAQDLFRNFEIHFSLHVLDIKPISMQPNQWCQKMQSLMQGKALCKTSKGYVSVVPGSTSITDEVFMIQGANLPFVLRPVQNRPGYYQILGGCYIHGLMRGEAWKLPHSLSETFLV